MALKLATDRRGKEIGILTDVMLFWVKLQTGDLKYQSKFEREYTADVVVDRKTAKQFNKLFTKGLAKAYDNEEFEDKFGVECPFPDQHDQYVIKMRANANAQGNMPAAQLKKVDVIPYEMNIRPKVLDHNRQDITLKTAVGNGSLGKVSFTFNENSYGTFHTLTYIMIDEDGLVEYEGTNSRKTYSPFGEVYGVVAPEKTRGEPEYDEEQEEDEEPVRKPKRLGKAAPKRKPAPEPEYDDEEEEEEEPAKPARKSTAKAAPKRKPAHEPEYDDEEEEEEEPAKPARKSTAKTAPKRPDPADEEDFDDDLPF